MQIGEIFIDSINTGRYVLKEKETNKDYNLAPDTELIIEWNKTNEITISNELKKSQVRVIKTDKEDNSFISDVEFDVFDENMNYLETIKTNEQGEAVTKQYATRDYKKLILQEKVTKENYVLDSELKTIILEENKVVDVQIQNEKIKGKVEVIKISADDNKLTGETKGTKLDGAIFEIYSEKDELVDTITIKDGIGTSKILEYGNYYMKEVNSGSDEYLLNTKKYEFEIKEHMKTIQITVENTSVDIGLDIDKNGVKQAQPNDEIKYSFNSLKNTSNVSLDNFTWTDNLPYEYVRITKLFTGTYNEDLDYVVKYKTNKSKEYIEFGTYNTQKNNYIDFTTVDLAKDEYITDFKVEFGTVMPGFEAVEKPFIFAKVLSTVKAEDKWTNVTSLTGNYEEYELEDKAEWTTISYGKKLTLQKLPRTGF